LKKFLVNLSPKVARKEFRDRIDLHTASFLREKPKYSANLMAYPVQVKGNWQK